MPRHVPHLLLPDPWDSERLRVADKTRQHLEKVLRFKGGEPVTYTDGCGRFGEGSYRGGAVSRGAETTEDSRRLRLTVAVAPPKSRDRVRFVVEKLAELGVAKLVWLNTSFTEGRPPRREKAEAWAVAALEQSRGCWKMEVGESTSLEDLTPLGTVLVAEPQGVPIAMARRIADPILCVGPEGGFVDGEVPESVIRVSLGESVLRIETAAIVGAALLISPA